MNSATTARCWFRIREIRYLFIVLALLFSLGVRADYLENAKEYLAKKQIKPAVIELKNHLQKQPNSKEGRYLLGSVYFDTGKYLEAIKELEKLRELGGDPNRWVVLLAYSQLRSGDWIKPIELESKLSVLTESNRSSLNAVIGHVYLLKNSISLAAEHFDKSLQLSANALARVGKARVALSESDTESALAELNTALQIDPDNVEAKITLAEIYFAKQELSKSLEFINQALEINPFLIQPWMVRAEIYLYQNKLDKGKSDIIHVLQNQPENPIANYLHSRLLLATGDFDEAITAAERALSVIPTHHPSYYILGVGNFQNGNYQQAKMYLSNYVLVIPDDLEAQKVLAATYLSLDEPKSAIDLLLKSEKYSEKPDHQMLYLLGRAYLEDGNHPNAVNALRRALEIDPGNAEIRNKLALGNMWLGSWDAAVTQLEETLKKNDSQEDSIDLLIFSYIRTGSFDQAHKLIDERILKQDKIASHHYLKAQIHEAQKDYGAAREQYNLSFSKESDYIPSYLSLAQLDIHEGNFDSARKNYQKALTIDPQNLQTLLLLARLSLSQDDTFSFIRWMNKAKSAYPDHIKPVELLVGYYLQTGEQDKAIATIESYLKIKKDDVAGLALMAKAYLAKQQYESAVYYMEKLVNLDRRDIDHRMMLAKLAGEKGDLPTASRRLKEVLNIDSGYAPAIVSMVQILLVQGKHDEANKIAGEFRQLNPDSYLNQRLKGDLYRAKGAIDLALMAYQNGYSKNKDPYLVEMLVYLYGLQHRSKDKIDLLSDYVANNQHDNLNRLRLAAAYAETQDADRALQEYEAVLSRDKDNLIALNNIAWLYLDQGDSRAMDSAKRAFKLAPDNTAILDTYGWVMLQEGDSQTALTILHDAATKSPDNPSIKYHFAKALQVNGQTEQAKEEVMRLLDTHSGFEEESEATQLLQQLGGR